ncbi:hypothetical protein R3P38DRAFT_3003914 [Favolaschia claudopus]|uniref:Uncharacterized protein n=1 Tax=Favolaschia claudopus TaxID=2862362 RepID=A0AAW0AMV2_9AGAR
MAVDSEVQLVPVMINLATIALESCFYGGFLVLAITSMCLLVGRRAKWWSPTFLGAIGMFITVTAHWILTVDRIFQAFVFFENGTFPAAFYGDLSQITEVGKTAFLITTVAMGDAIIIHRLWIIWDRRLTIVLFPVLNFLGLIVSGVGITYQFTKYKTGQNVFQSDTSRWITSNAFITHYGAVIISWRMWQVGSVIQPIGSHNRIHSVLGTIVESAAIYTTWTIFFFATYLSESNIQFITVDCVPAITGIACMLIHVRIGLGWAHEGSQAGLSISQSLPPLTRTIVTIAQHIHTATESPVGFELEKLRLESKGNDTV